MPLFQVDTQKEQLGEYWTNRYILEAASLSEAHALGVNIIGYEQVFHTTNVVMESHLTRPFPGPSNDQFIKTPRGFNGNYDGGALATQLPLFNVVRVDIPAEAGSPSRKYYRVGLTETMVEGSTIVQAYIDVVEEALDDMHGALAGALVDVDGQFLGVGAVKPQVAMRQLRRGSIRRTNPII